MQGAKLLTNHAACVDHDYSYNKGMVLVNGVKYDLLAVYKYIYVFREFTPPILHSALSSNVKC